MGFPDRVTSASRQQRPASLKPSGLLLLLCLGWLAAGCSAITSRALNRLSTPPPPLYFGGVRTDCELMANSRETDSPLVWPVYGVVDLPFSLGADLLLLPYDAYTDYHHRDAPQTAGSPPRDSD